MSKSEQIRALAKEGRTVSEIASELGISYQFAYNVCQKAGLLARVDRRIAPKPTPKKPPLSVERLCSGGFSLAGNVTHSVGGITMPSLPREPGVYAYAWEGVVHYLGVASRSLSQRLYGYCRPGPTQRTNQRMNTLLLETLDEGVLIELYYATPPDLTWNGFPISGCVGLEAGIISSFDLPLNVRGA